MSPTCFVGDDDSESCCPRDADFWAVVGVIREYSHPICEQHADRLGLSDDHLQPIDINRLGVSS